MDKQVNRRGFLRQSALAGGTVAVGSQLGGPVARAAEPATPAAGVASTRGRSLPAKPLMNGTAALSEPRLDASQLSFRIGLARTRTAAYPLNSMDFIMIDLERPDGRNRHATWCTGDLTGRLLEFLCCAEGVDGQYDPRLPELFERILKQRRPSGVIGRFGPSAANPAPENSDGVESTCATRLSCSLMRYYELTGDARALDAAVTLGNRLWEVRDNWRKMLKDSGSRIVFAWMSEFFTQLYAATKDARWMEFCAMVRDNLGNCDQTCQSHFYLSTLRGLQQMAILTGDKAWAEKAEANRRMIIDRRYEMPDGCIPECFPSSGRNEGCAIGDWLIVNLNAGLLGDPTAYDKAERIFWNALAFNQLVTGCFGHRPLTGNGYGVLGMEEAWWCCVHDAGMAMSEFARHAVTFRDGAVWVNLLTPGSFVVPLPGGRQTTVRIATTYPSRADATIEADNLPAEVALKVRVPACVRKADVRESRSGDKTRVVFHGELGHRIEQCNPGVLVTYGPLVLIPATGLSQPASLPNVTDSGVPAGYIPKTLPQGVPAIHLDVKPDAEGFVEMPLCPPTAPLPEWSFFDEGPGAPTWVEGAPVRLQLKYSDNQMAAARFTPMCYNTSVLALSETPVVFRGVE